MISPRDIPGGLAGTSAPGRSSRCEVRGSSSCSMASVVPAPREPGRPAGRRWRRGLLRGLQRGLEGQAGVRGAERAWGRHGAFWRARSRRSRASINVKQLSACAVNVQRLRRPNRSPTWQGVGTEPTSRKGDYVARTERPNLWSGRERALQQRRTSQRPRGAMGPVGLPMGWSTGPGGWDSQPSGRGWDGGGRGRAVPTPARWLTVPTSGPEGADLEDGARQDASQPGAQEPGARPGAPRAGAPSRGLDPDPGSRPGGPGSPGEGPLDRGPWPGPLLGQGSLARAPTRPGVPGRGALGHRVLLAARSPRPSSSPSRSLP